jgi:hypothetical protein
VNLDWTSGHQRRWLITVAVAIGVLALQAVVGSCPTRTELVRAMVLPAPAALARRLELRANAARRT